MEIKDLIKRLDKLEGINEALPGKSAKDSLGREIVVGDKVRYKAGGTIYKILWIGMDSSVDLKDTTRTDSTGDRTGTPSKELVKYSY